MKKAQTIQDQLWQACGVNLGGQRAIQARGWSFTQYAQVISVTVFAQALSIVAMVHPNWRAADLSQNINRMPVVPAGRLICFPCVTSGT